MDNRNQPYLSFDDDDDDDYYDEPVYKRSSSSSSSSSAKTSSSTSNVARTKTVPTTRIVPTQKVIPTQRVLVPTARLENPVVATVGGGSGNGALPWLTLFFIPILLVAAWLYTVSVTQSRFPKLRNKRICLLIAHPDDEAMFFAPSVVALTEPSLGNHVKILCLSSGDADGLGETRKKELVKSGLALGLRNEDDVFVVVSPDFPDSMTTLWSTTRISSLLSSAFAPHLMKPSSPTSTTRPTATIDVLITFDALGVSSHPNHISLFHGARHFISSLVANRPGWDCPVDLYTLTTVNVVRKYSSIGDVIISLIELALGKREIGESPSPLLFTSGIAEVRRSQRAMTHAHISQMRWFRWGWIGLSRYMCVNTLRLEKVTGKAAD